MTDAPVRLQLSRRKGYSLQVASLQANGRTARKVTRPGLFGNPFVVSSSITAQDATTSFRRFLKTWTDKQLVEGVRVPEGRSPIEGLGLVGLRNRIRANLWHLRNRNLACFCGPDSACHADVLLEILKTDLPERWKAKYPMLCHEVR